MTTKKKRIIIIICIGLAVLLIAAAVIFAVSYNRNAESPASLLRLGERYLLDLDYEQALVQFLRVIEIDPMNPRGYTGAAEAYIGLGQRDDAIDVLELGLERTGDRSIERMLDRVQGDGEARSDGNVRRSSRPDDNDSPGTDPHTDEDDTETDEYDLPDDTNSLLLGTWSYSVVFEHGYNIGTVTFYDTNRYSFEEVFHGNDGNTGDAIGSGSYSFDAVDSILDVTDDNRFYTFSAYIEFDDRDTFTMTTLEHSMGPEAIGNALTHYRVVP